jgi:biofilm PGA synthesis protein PgaA
MLICLFCALILVESAMAVTGEKDFKAVRQNAIYAARQGDYQEALAILEPLYLQAKDDSDLLYDYLTVLSWAEQDQKVITLINKVDIEKAPLFVVSAAAKSLRRLGKWEASESMYRLGIRRFPDDIDMQVGLVLALTDAGRPAEALRLAGEFINNNPGSNEILLAQAYSAEATNEVYRALLSYQKVLSRDRFHREARHKQIMLLHELGAYARSLELAEQYPEAVTQEEHRRLRSDADALAVRWSNLPPISEKKRFDECKHALTRIEKTVESPECRGARGKTCQRQARLDRLVALEYCSRSEEVIEDYKSLVADGEKLPGYVLEAVASAMLNIHEPEKALDLYKEVIRLNPKSHQARIGLFFALIETENFSEAQELIDKTVDEQSVWVYPGGMKTPRANWQGQTTELYAGLSRLFSDDLDEAERRFTAMANEAPANTDLLRELGSVYLARGWPRRSLEVIELGQALEPKHRGLRTGHAESYLALRKYDRAGEEIAALLAEYPEDQQVQRLDTQWQRYNMRELRIDTTFSNSSGSVNGDKEWEISTKVFSRPFHSQYRWFAGISYVQAEFPEGNGDLMRYSTGVEYASPGLEAALSTGFNDSESGHAGLWLDGVWHLDDYWSFPFNAEIYSHDTPLRAIRNGVRANALSFGLTYRAHESRSINFNAQIMDFNDSNFRTRFTLSGTQRLINLPKQKLNAFGELSVSNNSRNSVPYFNPESDFTLMGGLEHLWRVYRRYDHSLHQRVRVSAGNYTQRGYGSGIIFGFEYAHILELDNRRSMSYGLGAKRRVYDGDPEWNEYGFFSLNWRF